MKFANSIQAQMLLDDRCTSLGPKRDDSPHGESG